MPEIELLTVANHAETANGLLYLSGAGWTDLSRPVRAGGQVPVHHVGIGIAILLTHNELNRQYPIRIRIESATGENLAVVQANLQIGERQPGTALEDPYRAVMAVNAELQFPAVGVYRVVASAGDTEKTVQFRVHDAT